MKLASEKKQEEMLGYLKCMFILGNLLLGYRVDKDLHCWGYSMIQSYYFWNSNQNWFVSFFVVFGCVFMWIWTEHT